MSSSFTASTDGRAQVSSLNSTPARQSLAQSLLTLAHSLPIWKDDLVEGVLTEGGVSVFRGEFDDGILAYKAVTLALILGLHVAAGRSWCGRAVGRGGVIFLEGSLPAWRQRDETIHTVAAWRQTNGAVGIDLPFVVLSPSKFADAPRLLQWSVKRISLPIRLVVVLGPVANKGALAKVVRRLGAHMMWVDTEASRGTQVDTVLQLSDGEFGAWYTITACKRGDLTWISSFHFAIDMVDYAVDSAGEEVGDFVLQPIDAERAVRKPAMKR